MYFCDDCGFAIGLSVWSPPPSLSLPRVTKYDLHAWTNVLGVAVLVDDVPAGNRLIVKKI